MKPRVAHTEKLTWGSQDVELDFLMMVARQLLGNLGHFVHNRSQNMSVNGPSWNKMRQKKPTGGLAV